MKKQVIKTITFLVIFLILIMIVIKILWLPPSPVSEFYKEPDNSLDVIYIGSSNAFVYFNPVLVYDTFGFTTGLLAENSQPIILVKYLIKEAQKTQSPNLYVIDLAKAVDTLDESSEENIRQTTDSMRFSKNRIDAINAALSYKDEISKNDYNNFYYSFLMYHNKWKDISKANITGKTELYKGYWYRELSNKIRPLEAYKFKWTDDSMQLEDETEEILKDLVNYIKENNLKVLFVVPLRTYEENKKKKLNTVIKMINGYGYEVINFNTLEEFSQIIDYSNDFYDIYHLNIYGSTKYTLYFSKYLKEKYDLPNHKGDEIYKSWEQEYENFKTEYTKETNSEFDELLRKIYD